MNAIKNGVSKALYLPPSPKGGNKVLNIRKSPLGDLGVNLTERAFKTPLFKPLFMKNQILKRMPGHHKNIPFPLLSD